MKTLTRKLSRTAITVILVILAFIAIFRAWVFYTVLDDAWRPYAVFRHRVGTPVDDDVEVLGFAHFIRSRDS